MITESSNKVPGVLGFVDSGLLADSSYDCVARRPSRPAELVHLRDKRETVLLVTFANVLGATRPSLSMVPLTYGPPRFPKWKPFG